MARTLEDAIAACRAEIQANPTKTIHTLNLQYLPIDTELPADLPEGITHLYIAGCKMPYLNGAKLPKSLVSITVNGTELSVVQNLDQLPNLKSLSLQYCNYLYTLTCPLPRSLDRLFLRGCRYLREIPPIARTSLRDLDVGECMYLTSLPALPPTLISLNLHYSDVKEVPFLPDSVQHLWVYDRGIMCSETFLEITRLMQPINLHKERFPKIHEELMAATWHPKRVEAWLTHGEEVLDMMMGC
jgi:hypothetical protein